VLGKHFVVQLCQESVVNDLQSWCRLLATRIDAILTSMPRRAHCTRRPHTDVRTRLDSTFLPERLGIPACPIVLGELNSGKDDARAKRKQLIGVTESLIDRVEGQVKQYDKLKG
jgi:hypothetical protein